MTKKTIYAVLGVVALGGSVYMLTRSSSASSGSPAETARRMATGQQMPDRPASTRTVSRDAPSTAPAGSGRLTPAEEAEPAAEAEQSPKTGKKKKRSGSRRSQPKRKSTKNQPDVDELVPVESPKTKDRRGNRASRKP